MIVTRRQAVLVAALILVVAYMLYQAVTRPVPVPLNGTAIGPCTALPLGMTTVTVKVYSPLGELLAEGNAGRWRPTSSGASECLTSVHVEDVGAGEGYEIRLGPLVGNVDGRTLHDGQIFVMRTQEALVTQVNQEGIDLR